MSEHKTNISVFWKVKDKLKKILKKCLYNNSRGGKSELD